MTRAYTEKDAITVINNFPKEIKNRIIRAAITFNSSVRSIDPFKTIDLPMGWSYKLTNIAIYLSHTKLDGGDNYIIPQVIIFFKEKNKFGIREEKRAVIQKKRRGSIIKSAVSLFK